jgi:hypothetical protein
MRYEKFFENIRSSKRSGLVGFVEFFTIARVKMALNSGWSGKG